MGLQASDTNRSRRGGLPTDPGAGPATETFLFTDIEGSTRMVQRLGEVFAGVLAAHRRILLDAVEGNGGQERGVAGDGSLFVFPSARGAVMAAVSAQRALMAHPWPEGSPVRVRMGLHTGESETVPVRDEPGGPTGTTGQAASGIYAGLDVFRAARITAAGHGGQILLSQTTAQLVERDLPTGAKLRDLGAHHLKDLSEPERIWQLVTPDLPSEFPPIRSVATRPTNLPTRSSPFIGREAELRAVQELLLRPSARLVTLTGPGGTGKTRLAIESAAGLLSEFDDGVFIVMLGAITEPELIPSRIAETLAVSENPTRTAADALKEHLRDRKLLLILDNFEQVIDGAPFVAELFAECPKLEVLVTSRTELHLSGEYEYPVPPLPVPSTAEARDPAALTANPSVALFVERARAVRPGFELTPENAAAVATICASLDGLPLAIELAAARVKLFSPAALTARLGKRLDLLKGGARDLPARQQTLRQAIGWSYDLLDQVGRAVFRRLSVFRGGFTLDAVAPVCDPDGTLGIDPLDAVERLIDNSLLRAHPETAGEPRFGMLGTIQEFGLECLRSEGEESRVRRAHAEYFLRISEEAEPELTAADQGMWLDRLEVDHDNLRAALEWVVSQADAQSGLRFGAALWRFWVSRGHLVEGEKWLDRLLAIPGRDDVNARIRARLLTGVGTLLHEIGQYPSARRHLEEALALWRSLGDETGMATVLNNLSWMATLSGDLSSARALGEEALALHRRLDNARGMAVALHNLSWAALMESDFDSACQLITRALDLRHAAGDRRGAAFMKANQTVIESLQGNYDLAVELADAALGELHDLSDRQIGAWALQIRGRIAHAKGELDRARRCLEESVVRWREVGNRDALIWGLGDLGAALRDSGDLDRAEAIIGESLALAEGTELTFRVPYIQVTAGWIALDRGDTGRAERMFTQATSLAARTNDRRGYAEALEGFAALRAKAGAADVAAKLLGHAQWLRDDVGAPMPPVHHAAHAERLATLRAALGDYAFEAAWGAGQAMTTDRALVLATG